MPKERVFSCTQGRKGEEMLELFLGHHVTILELKPEKSTLK